MHGKRPVPPSLLKGQGVWAVHTAYIVYAWLASCDHISWSCDLSFPHLAGGRVSKTEARSCGNVSVLLLHLTVSVKSH